jgi:hypothetical protein
MDKNIIVPLGLFWAVAYTIRLLVDARMRYLYFKAGAPDTVQALFKGEAQLRRANTLRWGILLLTLGLAMGLAAQLEWPALSLPSLALWVGALGLGHLATYAAMRYFEKPPAGG